MVGDAEAGEDADVPRLQPAKPGRRSTVRAHTKRNIGAATEWPPDRQATDFSVRGSIGNPHTGSITPP